MYQPRPAHIIRILKPAPAPQQPSTLNPAPSPANTVQLCSTPLQNPVLCKTLNPAPPHIRPPAGYKVKGQEAEVEAEKVVKIAKLPQVRAPAAAAEVPLHHHQRRRHQGLRQLQGFHVQQSLQLHMSISVVQSSPFVLCALAVTVQQRPGQRRKRQ